MNLLRENVNPVVHLVSEGFHVAEGGLFRLENGFVDHVKVEQSLLSQVVALQSLTLFLKDLRHGRDQQPRLVLVAGEEVGEPDDTLLLIAQGFAHLAKVLLPLLRQTARTVVPLHLRFDKLIANSK